jgi:NitT/TauT family transport system ATP-binding protein
MFRERAEELLKLVGLSDFKDRYPHELSGGMQQRASHCACPCAESADLVDGRAFGALDAMTREQMNVELLRIWGRNRKNRYIRHSFHRRICVSRGPGLSS